MVNTHLFQAHEQRSYLRQNISDNRSGSNLDYPQACQFVIFGIGTFRNRCGK